MRRVIDSRGASPSAAPSAMMLAALVLGGALYPEVADAARRGKDKAAAPEETKVTVTAKAVLRAEASDIGKPLGKVRPKEKLTFLGRSDDGAWVQVRKGRIEGWLKADEIEGVPEVAAAAPDKAPDKAPENAPDKAPDKGGKPAAAGAAPAASPAAPASPPAPTRPEPPVLPGDPAASPTGPAPSGDDALAPAPPVAPPAPRLPLSGLSFSVGGGVALLGSSLTSTFKSGLNAELFNYDISTLPAIGAQARISYTYGYRWLRVGVDAGYRFAGGSQIVVKLPDRDAETATPGAVPAVLKGLRQDVSVNAHDADGGLSIGGYVGLGKALGLAVRARGGMQIHAFLPEFSSAAALPNEVFYGPLVGGLVELQSRSAPGFALRVDGSYIPYGVRSENTGLRDAVKPQQPSAECAMAGAPPERCQGNTSSRGYSVGAAAAFRVTSIFNVELGYRLVATESTYPPDTVPERLQFNRDPLVRARAQSEQERLLSSSRTTSQQTVYLGVSFNL